MPKTPAKGSTKDSSSFLIIKELENTVDLRSHEVSIARKVHKHNKDYYVKIAYDANFKSDPKKPELDDLSKPNLIKVAQRELFSQELIRFYLPHQPKTRLIVDPLKSTVAVASEEVNNLISPASLSKEEMKTGLLNGKYQGLGQLCVLALFLNETDFKEGNVVLSNNRFIKIDGDWAFSNIRLNNLNNPGNEIRQETIANLPFVYSYDAHNWIGSLYGGLLKKEDLFDPSMPYHPGFRKEVNEQMLKILITPPILLNELKQHYDGDLLDKKINALQPALNLLLTRQQQLFKAALDNPSFLNYLESNEAKLLVNEFKSNLTAFRSSENNHVITSNNQAEIEAAIDASFSSLQMTAAVNNISNTLIPPPPDRPPPPVPNISKP